MGHPLRFRNRSSILNRSALPGNYFVLFTWANTSSAWPSGFTGEKT